MAEAHNATRSLNPWVFHLQKLDLELKCPLCLNLLNKPMLLPCNHIFCNQCLPKPCQFSAECPACQQHYTNEGIRPASYMENIVSIYKSLDATFNSTILPLLSSDSGSPISISTSNDRLRRKPSETELKVKNSHDDTVLIRHVASGMENTKCCTSEELDVNNGPEVSPGSSPSFGNAKKAEHNDTDQNCRDGSTKYHTIKRSGGDKSGFAADVMDIKENSDMREHKRQKKLNYGTDAVLLSHGYSQQIVSHPDQVALSNCDEECKFEEDARVISSTVLCDAPNVNGSICSFCHSSKITEGTGRMLHYADGVGVPNDERVFSKAIPVHSKCIEWSPQVYFEGEKIMNLESELARSSKLKCSSCGLKGAALGCFAKSCRRTYHVPCALKVPDCRWSCDDFVMLCPIHKSIKFPSEKSRSRKRYSGEKSSLSSQMLENRPTVLSNFWASSPNGPQEWVFCPSALSSEDKLLLVKFAGKCGATVFKAWNPNVTHVIAATDLNGACSRTLKVLMAILNGKWVLTMDWIKACSEANRPVDEETYEVNLDNHGFRHGPKSGRLRVLNNGPKFFDGLSFYFTGDFLPSYKSDLLDLVRVGGGSIIESMEQIDAHRHNPQVSATSYVVYNLENPQMRLAKETGSDAMKRLADAEVVAKNLNANLIPHTWILESIAACKVLPSPSS